MLLLGIVGVVLVVGRYSFVAGARILGDIYDAANDL